MDDLEPYLSDHVVHAVQEKAYEKYPRLILWNTDFVTACMPVPWHGTLPNGKNGYTNNPVVEFIVVSDHPRPIQRKNGIRHATVATAWQQAFDESMKEAKNSADRIDPVEVVFKLTLLKHIDEMESLASIQYDAVSDPSRPKSVYDVL